MIIKIDLKVDLVMIQLNIFGYDLTIVNLHTPLESLKGNSLKENMNWGCCLISFSNKEYKPIFTYRLGGTHD